MNGFCLYIINIFTSPKSVYLWRRCIHAFEWLHSIVYIEIVQFKMSHRLNSIRIESNNLFVVYMLLLWMLVLQGNSIFNACKSTTASIPNVECWFRNDNKITQIMVEKCNQMNTFYFEWSASIWLRKSINKLSFQFNIQWKWNVNARTYKIVQRNRYYQFITFKQNSSNEIHTIIIRSSHKFKNAIYFAHEIRQSEKGVWERFNVKRLSIDLFLQFRLACLRISLTFALFFSLSDAFKFTLQR